MRRRRTCDEKKIGIYRNENATHKTTQKNLDQSKASSVCTMARWLQLLWVAIIFSWKPAAKQLTACIFLCSNIVNNHEIIRIKIKKTERKKKLADFRSLQIDGGMQNIKCMCEVRAKIHRNRLRAHAYQPFQIWIKTTTFHATLCSSKERSETVYRSQRTFNLNRTLLEYTLCLL